MAKNPPLSLNYDTASRIIRRLQSADERNLLRWSASAFGRFATVCGSLPTKWAIHYEPGDTPEMRAQKEADCRPMGVEMLLEVARFLIRDNPGRGVDIANALLQELLDVLDVRIVPASRPETEEEIAEARLTRTALRWASVREDARAPEGPGGSSKSAEESAAMDRLAEQLRTEVSAYLAVRRRAIVPLPGMGVSA